MPDSPRRPRALPLHPLLIGAFPVLFLFGENVWGVSAREVIVPFVATVLTIGILLVVFSRLTSRPREVAIVLSVVTLVFFSYGHAWRLLAHPAGKYLGIDVDFILGPLAILLIALTVAVVVRTRRELVDVTRVLNIVALVLVVTVAVPLAIELFKDRDVEAAISESRLTTDRAETNEQRDIYYLVFDRYAGNETLKELFGYDNRVFLDYLTKKGFQIADDARANYHNTVSSLAASLNLKYLDYLSEDFDEPTRSIAPTIHALQYHEVGAFLQTRGYRYVHIGSRWDMTRASPIADTNVFIDRTSEFTRAWLTSTALLPAMRRGFLGPPDADDTSHLRATTFRQLEAVMDSKTIRGPKFVFSHFGLPHPPYPFDRDGSVPKTTPRTLPERANAYLRQLEFTNAKIREIVDHLLDVPEKRRPIVIVGSEEGPYPGFWGDGIVPWWSGTDQELRTKFRILMAVYMPSVDDNEVYDTMSPVNLFRVVFNAYFGTDLEILPDESYVARSKEDAYNWVRITNRIRDLKEPIDPLFPPAGD